MTHQWVHCPHLRSQNKDENKRGYRGENIHILLPLCRVSLIILLMILLNGCTSMTDEEYEEWKFNQPTYSYERVEATITKINTNHWFAGTHRYEWQIEVYYGPYDLMFSENSWETGMFNCPSFFDKKEGDSVAVEVQSEYAKGELKGRKIIRIIR